MVRRKPQSLASLWVGHKALDGLHPPRLRVPLLNVRDDLRVDGLHLIHREDTSQQQMLLRLARQTSQLLKCSHDGGRISATSLQQ